MSVVLAVTDGGPAYIKPLGGSNYGSHCLGCELIGTRLAEWLGLPTLAYAIMQLTSLDAEMIRDAGGQAEPGPAFATQGIDATPWGGSAKELEGISNPEDIPKLVLFDTWTLNWDRCPPSSDCRSPNYDNVLLARPENQVGGSRLLAIDHGECFCVAQELTTRISSIERVKDDRVFGLFLNFKPFMRNDVIQTTARRMAAMDRAVINRWVSAIPAEWEVPTPARRSLVDLICGRALYLADRISERLRHSSGNLFDTR